MKHPLLAACLLGSLLTVPALARTDPPADTAAAATAPNTTPTTADAALGAPYQFQAFQHDDLVGTVYEVDCVDADGHQTPVLEIPAGTKTLTPMDRARIIAGRLQKASLADRSFWSKLTPAFKKKEKEYVLAPPGDSQFVVTADGASAALNGMPTDKFADFLLKQIKNALDSKLRDAKFDYQLSTPEEKQERANIYRQQGEQAYQQKDEVRAEAMYTQSKKVAPEYAVAYLGLAGLYVHQGSRDKAKKVLKEGLDRNLDLAAVAEQVMGDQDHALLTLIGQVKNGG